MFPRSKQPLQALRLGFFYTLIIVAFSAGHLSLLRASSADSEQNLTPLVVYGDDDRREIFEEKDPLIKILARSTVAIIPSTGLAQTDDGSWAILGENYQQTYNLCPTEKYVEQSVSAICSGFLATPDSIVTAGHCILDEFACAQAKIVFDFALEGPGAEPRRLDHDDVYSCREVIASSLMTAAGTGSDYAIIRLDREVGNRMPLALRRRGQLKVGDDLFVIGHPSGLPAKVAGGASVRSIGQTLAMANLDTYIGNSGSPIFNAESKEVEGVLVTGEQDFVAQGACNVTNRCSDSGCRGEEFTKISEMLRLIPPVSIKNHLTLMSENPQSLSTAQEASSLPLSSGGGLDLKARSSR